MIKVIKKKNPSKEIRNRFYVEKAADGGYDLIDDKWRMVINFENKTIAEQSAKIARDYVKKWGDIDFSSFPYDLNTVLKSPDKNYLNSHEKIWKGKSILNKNKIELLFSIFQKDGNEIIYLKNLNTNQSVQFYLKSNQGKFNSSYNSILIFVAEKLGMDDYPNYESAYKWFNKNQNKILIFKDKYEFDQIYKLFEGLK